jgi:hypothetical protein
MASGRVWWGHPLTIFDTKNDSFGWMLMVKIIVVVGICEFEFSNNDRVVQIVSAFISQNFLTNVMQTKDTSLSNKTYYL